MSKKTELRIYCIPGTNDYDASAVNERLGKEYEIEKYH